jgi:hypothetical protein
MCLVSSRSPLVYHRGAAALLAYIIIAQYFDRC